MHICLYPSGSGEKMNFLKVSIPSKYLLLILLFLFISISGYKKLSFIYDSQVVAIESISIPENISPRGGEIIITYSKPVYGPKYSPANIQLISKDDGSSEKISFRSLMSKGYLQETITLADPTKYNTHYTLENKYLEESPWWAAFGFVPAPKYIKFKTDFQYVAIETLIPSEKITVAPEEMNNQIGIKFSNPVRGKVRTGVNILPRELDFITMDPQPEGYYQWSDDQTLIFKFTTERPQYQTTYSFSIKPEKLINLEYQKWNADKDTIALTTSTYEVYVSGVSTADEVHWQQDLEIEFSGSMVGVLDILKPKDPELVPITMQPKVKGIWQWSNSRTIKFQPDRNTGWPVKQIVNIEVLPQINTESDRDWSNNRSLNSFNFYVKPRVQSISSYNLRGSEVELEKNLRVRFSRDLVESKSLNVPFFEPDSANNPFIIEPEVSGKFIWLDKKTVEFAPDNLWPELTEIKASLNPRFNPDKRFEWQGSKSLQFITVENLIIPEFYLTPENRIPGNEFFSNKTTYSIAGKQDTNERLWIKFNKSLGSKIPAGMDLSKAITIVPAIKGKYTWLSGDLLEFQPDNNWLEETEYKIELTDKLFYHPEQHYPESMDGTSFSTKKNVVSVDLGRTVTKDNEAYRLKPEHNLDIKFTKNMNPLVKIGRVYTTSEAKPDFWPIKLSPVTDYSFEWKTARNLIITPQKYWLPSTDYTLSFNSSLLPQSQAKFQEDLPGKIYTTENKFRIISFSPTGTTSNVPEIEVKFSKDIKPANVKIGDVESDGMFMIKPVLPGKWLWKNNDRLIYETSETLNDSTQYQVDFYPEKVSDKQFTWYRKPGIDEQAVIEIYRFNTEPLYVETSDASFTFDENNILKQRFSIDIKLSTEANKDELARNFSIWFDKETEDGKVKVPLLYKMEAEGEGSATRHLIINSELIDRPSSDRRIYYKINNGIKAIKGDLPLASDFHSDFLQEKPKYLRINNVNWQHKDYKHYAKLYLNSPVDPERLKKFLLINEETNIAPLDYIVSVENNNNQSQFVYLIEADFLPAANYKFLLKPLLLAEDGAFTNDDVSYNSNVPTLNRSLDFGVSGSILSKFDIQSVPIHSTNVKKVYLKVDKVFPNNVAYLINNNLRSSNSSSTLKSIYHETHNLKDFHSAPIENKLVKTHVDLKKLFKENKRGFYKLSINSRNTSTKDRFFLSTDLGMLVRRSADKLIIWVNSLSTTSAKAGVKIEFIDKWNQVAATAYTDASGVAVIDNYSSLSGTLLFAKTKDDFAYVDLRNHKETFSAIDVSGASSGNDLKTYIYSERGVYRPGDTVHFVAVNRNTNGGLPHQSSMNFTLKGPTGQERSKERFNMQSNGLYVYDYHIPTDAKTGKWSAQVTRSSNNETGAYTFQVEEFIPNKIKVKLQAQSKPAAPGEDFKFTVQANNLFGPPAANRVVSANVSLRPAYFKPKGFNSFTFGHDDNQFQKIEEELLQTKLDENGHIEYSYLLPKGVDSPIGLYIHYSATVVDDGGRAVTEYSKSPVELYPQYVGVKLATSSKLLIAKPMKFSIVNVQASGAKIEREQQNLTYKVYRNKLVTHFRKNERGYFRYVTEKINVLVTELEDERDADGILSYSPSLSGEHYLEVRDEVGDQVTRMPFWVTGPVQTASIVEAPQRVEIKQLTKQAYLNGNVDLEIRTPFPGKLLLTGERDKVLFHRVIDMKSNHTTVRIPVLAKHFPNFYLSATVIQEVSKGGNNKPVYAKGMINIDVVDKAHTPELKLFVADKVAPNSKLKVDIAVNNTNKEDMFVTIAAVDVGILDLTKFKTPSMENYFKTKRRLEVQHYSIYPWLMPYQTDIKAKITPSGGVPARALVKKKRVNPSSEKRVKSVALWSGLLKFDATGKATVELDVPEFDGRLRVMAVAFGDQRFNSAEKEVIVRDDLVMKPTLPRFLATGDNFSIPVNLFNATDIEGSVSIDIVTTSHVEALGPSRKTINIAAGAEAATEFSFKVLQNVGLSKFTLIAKGLGEETRKVIEIPVRAPGNYVSLSGSGVVDSVASKVVQIPDLFRSGTENFGMMVTTNGLFEFGSSINYLLRYPHGCLEQTTSKVFPLIYFDDMVKQMDSKVLGEKSAGYFVKEGINKIERMQLENGYYSYWMGGSSVNNWAYIFASHFMVESKNAGYDISENVWNNMIYRLQEDAKKRFNSSNSQSQLTYQNYILYVLALANVNVQSEANYLYDNHYSMMKNHEKARLAATFALLGNKQKGKSMIQGINDFSDYVGNSYRETGASFASSARDLAMMLDSIVSVDPNASIIPSLVKALIETSNNGRWRSTQENAFAFMALGKTVAKGAVTKDGDIKITLGNGDVINYETAIKLGNAEMLSGEISIETTGDAEARFFWVADGVSNKDVMPDDDQNLKIRRKYLDKEGKPVDLQSIKQGDLIVAEIRMQSLSGTVENVVVTDLLPMGLEIENARLSTAATIPWIKPDAKADHIDIRDDRFNVYLTLTDKESVLYYTTRAVTVGSFAVPSIRAEAMYDEKLYSVSSAGKIKISPLNERSNFALSHQ